MAMDDSKYEAGALRSALKIKDEFLVCEVCCSEGKHDMMGTGYSEDGMVDHTMSNHENEEELATLAVNAMT